ncbi:hypothetical protein K2173_009627 [Erythroxylum novogranatense]|uniref:Midasin n=1 Tax=Erythroxylum novogranatense TaxID=1862640 RepID=A0AAV8U5N2_9ROSI|nr:hypothetical protein K2173_009627 [Erythroxylum novogranatense]
MALEYCFSLDCAIKRLIARCPELVNSKLNEILGKDEMMVEEAVVKLLAELFPNPKYTIPLWRCFRPIVRKIVERVVAMLGQCNLSSDLGEMADEEIIYVVESCDRSGKGMVLHELACLAFCRALELDRCLWGLVSAYFKFAPPPFQRFLRNATVYDPSKVVANLFAARISYRLLLLEPEYFSQCWDWSCFLELVKNSVNLDLVPAAEHTKEIADIRWCGIQVLSVVLKIGDRAIANFHFNAEDAASCLMRWEEFCQDVATEKVGLYTESSDKVESIATNFNQQNCLESFGVNSFTASHSCETEPMSKSRRMLTCDGTSVDNVFVMTSSVMKSFDMAVLAVRQKWPVLLYGPAGAGKTAIINKLARDAGTEVLSIHMDDQLDGKTLLGSYVCTEQPGEFRWQPGSLIQAALNGFWVVFEDIDKAAPDVQSILLPLLEGASSFTTSHGEEIRVAESFRLFSTITTSKSDISRSAEGGNLISNLWRKVMIGLPNTNDLLNIVKAWFPELEPLAGKLVETLERVNSALVISPNRFSSRDLLKLCKRIAAFGYEDVGKLLTAYQCHCIYQEAVDIFTSFLVSVDNRLTVMKAIAKLWAIPIPDTGVIYPHKPELQGSFIELRIGRVTLQRSETALRGHENLVKMCSSLNVLEKIACSIKYNEPVLLVGETGTGKTTLVQNLAMMLGQRLSVLNLSQQSDVADLLGGFKPMDPQSICIPLYKEFVDLFSKTFSAKENDKLFAFLQKQLISKNWKTLLSGFKKYVDNFEKKVKIERTGSGRKRKKPLDEEEKVQAWEKFSVKLVTARGQIGVSSGMIFSFVEGAFVTALRKGEWILLDEVNLAPPETLQRLIGVLEGEFGSLCLPERGDASHIPRHPNFRIFACMNPATDAGKRDLPHALRSRFTEHFVHDFLDREDLRLFIRKFMEECQSDRRLEENMIDFYESAKRISEERLQDGANQKPQYSLRSLYRALEYINKGKTKFGFQKAIYDGFSMFFLNLLDRSSAKVMKKMIIHTLLRGKKPPTVPIDYYLTVKASSMSGDFLENYVLTKSVTKQLENLARAVFIKRYPVLLQGPTSSGKTSLVQYLAARTGHEFVRINNHEHTDLQEYLGSYISDVHGKLIFHEGVLVRAVRNGYWIVLDELNLAPSDVLEAMNRLLDDNRELYVPELRETIRAHPNFMLFATQNPPNIYGGRKILSRAFRNRFVEIHVDEIPENELITIIEKRGKIPGSRAKLMVEVMKELQLLRQSSKVFAGKHGFITPRDLFRWASRLRTFGYSKEVMAEHGYYLLADRLRDERERSVVQEVLEKVLRVKIANDDLYKGAVELDPKSVGKDIDSFGDVMLTKSMRRLYFLVKCCYELREPVLLVGETGGGKTTVCQLLSRSLGARLHILNCHQYTETSDFLGGFYPIRERSRLMSQFEDITGKLMLSKASSIFSEGMKISPDIRQAPATLDQLASVITSYRQGWISCPDFTARDLGWLEQMKLELTELHQKWQAIFMWQDGPLVQAMKEGDLFLVDEISLADDSVLERLNSVLEPERKLALAEKGGSVMEEITAHENFFALSTMNPGGDYGKKELSPALRNRFTEIFVPPVSDIDELRDIAKKRFQSPELSYIVDSLLKFWEWFKQLQTGKMLTVRDLLSWIEFINVTKGSLGTDDAFLHGLFLVVLDGLSLGTGISTRDALLLRKESFSFLLKKLKLDHTQFRMEDYGWEDHGSSTDNSVNTDMLHDKLFGIHPFYIEKGLKECEARGFEFLAPTTRRNALRVLRAMQLAKPVLLEGSPGVGKTSLVSALGKYSGHKVVRINLSEQTDLMDLLGSDLPLESEEGMKFIWSDGILLQALKEGSWVLLDELNLAPQSVLEGLNSILDHRAEVFIPELGLTYKCPSSFRVFACQNPFSQGGGRKGLPKSFLNRFTKVYVDELSENDYLFICRSLYPAIPRPLLSKLIFFNKRLHEDTMLYHKFAQSGSPWEFNLRDVIRSCQIIQEAPAMSKVDSFVNVLYVQRMRSVADRKEVAQLYEQVFGEKLSINPNPRMQINPEYFTVGTTAIKRNSFQSSKFVNSPLHITPNIRCTLEAIMHCVQHQWMCILVGPSSSGKTSLIRLLAQLTGNSLNELNLSSATDISELLGSFEQYNTYRNFRAVVAQVEQYINEYCCLWLQSTKAALTNGKNEIITRWLSFLSSVYPFFVENSTFDLKNGGRIGDSLSLLIEIIEGLKLDVATHGLPVSWSSGEVSRTMKAILKLQVDQQKQSVPAKFEWVTGSLIKAIENGEWVVLKNANLCSPTVLDRINSLVESSGSITINERGIVDGAPMVVHPHSNFRIFLTVNPSYGEVSRAMRNRGVEIFMMQPYWLVDEESDFSWTKQELRDAKRFLVLSGVPFTELVDSMAKAHVHTRNEGLKLNTQVTYLELTRWVQLFQQLLVNGHQPFWSLQTSWEHTYLSSFGEAEGQDIINHAKVKYLSKATLSKSEFHMEFPLYMAGGWPVPLKVRDFTWYSRETSIKQNCLYLEYLVALCELGESWSRGNQSLRLFSTAHTETSLIDTGMVSELMFPKASEWKISNLFEDTEFELKSMKKMICFAANWAIEQATVCDYKLYLLRLSWLGSKFQCLNHFLTSFCCFLEQEINHPIWKCIFHCHRELLLLLGVDVNMQPIPLLSLDLVNFTASSNMAKTYSKLLHNAIECISLLRLSIRQWNVQTRYSFTYETRHFKPVLDSLQELEMEILDILVESPSFDMLLKLYNNLLEDHLVFWDAFTSLHFEFLLISWRSLENDISKLCEFCPRAARSVLLMASQNLDEVFNQRPDLPLIWIHGGHPILPSSEKLYCKQQELLELCETIWPTRTSQFKQINDHFIEVAASLNPELRFLAVQGICMSSYIISNCDEDADQVVQQLEEMTQMLLERFSHEKHKLNAKLQSHDHAVFEENITSCCDFNLELLSTCSGFFSWQETVSIVVHTSLFLDMELLQKLSSIVLTDPRGSRQALRVVLNMLECALKYPLAFSARPPQNFIPHQKILWALDAWTSVDATNGKITNDILEMWSCWHLSLWDYCPDFVKKWSLNDVHDFPHPAMLIQPVGAASVMHILRQATCPIKDYSVHALKLKVASCNFWRSSLLGTKSPSSLLFLARGLFEQIMYVHERAFSYDKFAEVKSILLSFQKYAATIDDIRRLSSLIESSSHQGLSASLQHLIEPVVKDLYHPTSSAEEFQLNIGYAWLRIGGLRFHLLLSCDDLDPALKYSCKNSQLKEKISSLELEVKVRQECNYLAGWSSSKTADEKKADALQKLKAEHKRLQQKMVFRSDPSKYKALRKECKEFYKLVMAILNLINDIDDMELQQLADQAYNWQETATCFIHRLSEEYKEYIDVTQPVQVAVYEIKLGLSLLLTGALQKKFLNQIQEHNLDKVMESIYSFMRFPGGFAFDTVSSDSMHSSTDFLELETSLLEKLVSVSDVNSEKVSSLHLKTVLHSNVLAHIARYISVVQRIDCASFKMMCKIFGEFASMWMDIKANIKSKEGHDAQEYKFRPRAFEIKSVVDDDISSLGNLFNNDSFTEWQELLHEEESSAQMETRDDFENLGDWNFFEEPCLNDIINMHNRLFGSFNLVQHPQKFLMSDSERLLLFTNSYTLGGEMIKGFKGLHASSLDAKLVPEHLFRLCLEYKRIFGLSNEIASKYNFYKDSNAPVMAKMVKLLATLRQRILVLLNEWEDHPGLQKIMDAIEMLLAIPLDTPLAKALSGLQFLLNRARVLQEGVSKFPLSELLEPVIPLVCSWQKMEFDSWPALLDEVHYQYEINAAKLWFPLYSVLHHRHSTDLAAYEQSTVESLEEFIQTSSIGELGKRLQLLFAFHGQISTGRCLGVEAFTSPWQEINLKILYNAFGYYVQFLPLVSQHIEVNRRNIEKELTEMLKLCRWERTEAFLSVENSKRTRQKLKKLIEKYTVLLQQPVMLIFNQEVERKGTCLHSLRLLNSSEKNVALFETVNRSKWLVDWSRRMKQTQLNLHSDRNLDLSFLDNEEVRTVSQLSLACQSACLLHEERWDEVCQMLDRIFRTTIECDNLWKDTKTNIGKKRAFAELLKLLESSGLHKHKFEIMKICNNSKWLFVQPSYDSEHLLPTQSRLLHGASDVSTTNEFQRLPNEEADSIWKQANEFYFKSLASAKHLQLVCLKPHEDITYEQACRAISFVNHLIDVQQTQRASAYAFAEHLKCLRKSVAALENSYMRCIGSDQSTSIECSIARNQSYLFECLWKQKKLFDGLAAMLFEEALLLKTVESTHLTSCQKLKLAADRFLKFVEKCSPIIQKSKDALDNYLLDHVDAISASVSHPYVISVQMEHLMLKNFQVIMDFEEQLLDFRKQDSDRSLVIEVLLGRFGDAFMKAKLLAQQFSSMTEAKNKLGKSCEVSHYGDNNYSYLEDGFSKAIKKTVELIKDALRSMSSECTLPVDLSTKFTSWEYLFKSFRENVNIEELCKSILETISLADKMVNQSSADTSHASFSVGTCFEYLHSVIDLIMLLCEGLLQRLLEMHKTVSVMTHVLASVLSSLFSNGFGIPSESQADDVSHDASQGATGIGMGEGSGLNDVSDQITDEDQLIGTSEKPGEEQNDLDKLPSKNDKGIEMEQDFDADAFSVSEDSAEENDEDDGTDSKDEQLESAMGETGADSEVVKEKPWDKEQDENPDDTGEKYESGTSVHDRDASNREVRAKEDSAAIDCDEPEKLDSDEPDKPTDEFGDQDDAGDGKESVDGMNLDKEEASADPTGVKTDDLGSDEDMDVDGDMNEKEGLDSQEDLSPEVDDESTENVNPDEDNTDNFNSMDEADTERLDGTSETNDAGKEGEENSGMDATATREDAFGPGISDLMNGHGHKADSAIQAYGQSQASNSEKIAPDTNTSNAYEAYNNLVLQRSLPSDNMSETDILLTNQSNNGSFTDQQKEQSSSEEFRCRQESQMNPYRNVGNAFEEWKERVKVSVDLPEGNKELGSEEEDKNADEYGYVPEFEKGTAQALGAASSEQIDANVNDKNPDEDIHADQRDDIATMEIEKQNSEDWQLKHCTATLKNNSEKQLQFSNFEMSTEARSPEVDEPDDCDLTPGSLSESFVSVSKSYLGEDIHQFSKLSVNDEKENAEDEEVAFDTRSDSYILWKRYELRTARLSQELAEQLRLVMEPTLASKLQGDYKTGKRINMKKVIPYIASHYRKDKIWLRRTRPNKRDYQVIIAIDDSRSMSESRCGDVAVEALITVCRAMSQLEMGNLAVASFGKKGNIRLLNDFDQPFTGEAGVKIISNLTFRQDNTIVDEPVVDLLKYLNKMLDAAVSRSRLPSGQNPLQQLVLIIADGRFHEKEKLKRCVRDFLSQKRMVAFLLLDSPDESIMNHMEASFVGEGEKRVLKFTKYLDSFPFPFYLVLRNIESLPRTLADLLRQWFELMQLSKD